MSFETEQEGFYEYRITNYSTSEGLDYMTIQHLLTGICLGSEPVVREDINNFDKSIQHKIIHEDTKHKLISEMAKLAQDLIV